MNATGWLPSILLCAALGAVPALARPEDRGVELEPGVTLRAVDAAEAAEALPGDPDWRGRSGLFRGFLVGAEGEVSEERFQEVARAARRDWTPDELHNLKVGVALLRPLPGDRRLPLPRELRVIKVGGGFLENNAWGNDRLLILSTTHVASALAVKGVLAHELFHCATDHSHAFRVSMYALIGFRECGPLQLPPERAVRVPIDLPDANAWCTTLRVEGEEVTVFPLTGSGARKCARDRRGQSAPPHGRRSNRWR